jgi:hypothetical protein
MASENECPVCFGPCAKLSVTCCNGHAVCEKHYLQRYKAIYEEGRTAFHDDNAQCCFMCRSKIQDSSFSKPYFDLLEIVIAQGVLKRAGITDKDIFHEHLLKFREVKLSYSEWKEQSHNENGDEDEKDEEKELKYPTSKEVFDRYCELAPDNDDIDDAVYDVICEWDEQFAGDTTWCNDEETDVKDRLRDEVLEMLGECA